MQKRTQKLYCTIRADAFRVVVEEHAKGKANGNSKGKFRDAPLGITETIITKKIYEQKKEEWIKARKEDPESLVPEPSQRNLQSNVSRALNKLVKDGLVEKNEFKEYVPTQQGIDMIHRYIQLQESLRAIAQMKIHLTNEVKMFIREHKEFRNLEYWPLFQEADLDSPYKINCFFKENFGDESDDT